MHIIQNLNGGACIKGYEYVCVFVVSGISYNKVTVAFTPVVICSAKN